MPTHEVFARRRAVQLYVAGMGVVLLGAFLRDYFDSLAPLAACSSAALMLGTPLLRQLKRQVAQG